MGHRAGREFFEEKRPWSKRKDQVLAYYLTPFLPKIATLGKPIVIVDAFAGPGRFGNGDPGSPLIIADAIRTFAATHPSVQCAEVCIEPDPELHARLVTNLQGFAFTLPELSSFLEFLPQIEKLATSSSVFIYADPFAIEGLEWEAMDRVFRFIAAGSSVELLLNFNACAFVRRARAELHYAAAREDPGDDDDASAEVGAATLDRVVGGNWWREIVTPDGWFPGEVADIAGQLKRQLQSRFGEAGIYDIRANLTDRTPKYYLIYASRHPDGLCLINEAVCKDRAIEVEQAGSAQALLFEQSPQMLPSVDTVLRPALLKLLRDGMRRRDLQVAVTRDLFGQFREKSIRSEIQRLRAEGKIRAVSEAVRLNDESRLFHK